MNYYSLPIKSLDLSFNIKYDSTSNIVPIISSSFFYNIPYINQQFNIKHIKENSNLSDTSNELLNKICNLGEMLSDIIPIKFFEMYNKNKCIPFFTAIEMLSAFDILNMLLIAKDKVRILYIGDNPDSLKNAISFLVGKNDYEYEVLTSKDFENSDWHISYAKKNDITLIYVDECSTDYTYVESYILFLIKVMCIIIARQKTGSSIVLKLNTIFFKPIIDIIYILTSQSTNTYIVKPLIVSNIDNRYAVFTNMKTCQDIGGSITLNTLTNKIKNYIKKEGNGISSISDHSLSHYFISKVEECNLVIGQKYIEYYENIVLLTKNFAKEDRIENIKKNTIIKCAHWCEKYNIPYKK